MFSVSLDGSWLDCHFAFAADAARLRELGDAVGYAEEKSRQAWRMRAPDGWAPAEDGSFFVPAPPPSGELLDEELRAFYEPIGLLCEESAQLIVDLMHGRTEKVAAL